MTFQPGEEVRCGETIAGTPLIGGMVYTIRRVSGNVLFFDEVDGGWWSYRFVKIKRSATFVLDNEATE
jgi:hypothetical protein